MKINNDIPLGQRFPKFEFAKTADRWLAQAKQKTIFQQLNSRKIDRICILRILCTAALGIEEPLGKFCVYFNEDCKIEHAFGCIGHEIAHTFHFDLTKNPPAEIIDQQSHEYFYDFDDDGDPRGFIIEDFCDEFAKKWFFANTKEKIVSDCKDNDGVLASIILMFSNSREEFYTT